MSSTSAASSDDMHWVMKFNAEGPPGLIDKKAPGQQAKLNPIAAGRGSRLRNWSENGSDSGEFQFKR
jgi:hypothetical protein